VLRAQAQTEAEESEPSDAEDQEVIEGEIVE
jgi:hypothetical protein